MLLADFAHDLHHAMDPIVGTVAIFLNLSKAFGHVPHRRLGA